MASLLSAVADFLFPPACAACTQPIPAGLSLCAPCAARLRVLAEPICPICGIPILAEGSSHICLDCLLHPPQFRRARAAYVYDARDEQCPLRRCLQRFKYNLDTAQVRPLADAFAVAMPIALNRYDVVIPVPLHRDRLRWRGFNQSLLLLRALSRRVPSTHIARSLLIRRQSTRPQVELTGAERRQNVRGAFAVAAPAAIRGRRVLLFDDVLTTGATVDECARTLRRAGAAHVDVLVLARAVRQ